MKSPAPLSEKELEIEKALTESLKGKHCNAQELVNVLADMIAKTIAMLDQKKASFVYEEIMEDILNKAYVYMGYDFYSAHIRLLSREEWKKERK